MAPAPETRTIQELAATLIDYRGKTPPKSELGIKLITAKVIKDGSIVNGNHEYISHDTYQWWMRRGLPRQWDILLTTEAPLGEVAQLRTNEQIALAQRVILVRGNQSIIDQGYLFQAMRSPFFQAELARRSTGTTVLGIKQSELRHARVPYHSLSVQRKIASILSAYDDLIENNTRRIAILEQMAQALYHEWFVRFRFPGHEHVRMVDSPLGPIPEGWRVVRLGEMVELAYGKALRAEDRHAGYVPVFGSSGMVGYHDVALVDGPGIIIGRKGNVGSVHWSDEAFYPIDTVYFVRSELPLQFLYFNLQYQHFINNDAAVPGLNRNQAYSLPLLLPSQGLLAEFERHAETVFATTSTLAKLNEVSDKLATCCCRG
jgi:type I restriction enzyme S subunit